MIKIGLLGLGNIGKIHAKAYSDFSNIELYGLNKPYVSTIYSPNSKLSEEIFNALGKPYYAKSIEDFYRSDFDMIDICTPNYLHKEHIEKALNKKIAIYCEKPLTTTLDDSEKIVEKTSQNKLFTHTAFVYRYFEAVQKIKKILKDEHLGKPFHFRMTLYYGGYIDKNKPFSWRLKKELSGGGALIDLGIHLIDLSRFFFGEPNWISCATNTFISKRPSKNNSSFFKNVDVDDWSKCIIGYKNNINGSIEVSRVAAGMPLGFEILVFCEKGTIKIKPGDMKDVHIYDCLSESWRSDYDLEPENDREKKLYKIYKENFSTISKVHLMSIYDFLSNIKNQKESELNFSEALLNQKIVNAAYQSAKNNSKRVFI